MPPAKASSTTRAIPPSLRDACVEAAREVIARDGIEHLSLRAVARALGVSHYAPYKHFPTREHLLAEVLRRCFAAFAEWLDGRPAETDPRAALQALGERYLAFAVAHPFEYRLMFSTPWPAMAASDELVADARHPFEILRRVLRHVHGETPGGTTTGAARRHRGASRPASGVQASPSVLVDLDALYIWSAMHGLAGVLHGSAITHLSLEPGVMAQAVAHIMVNVGRGLGATDDATPARGPRPRSSRRR